MTQVITDDARSTNVPSSGPRSQRVCRHFTRGRCTWGASCRFSHDMERAALDEPQAAQQAYIAEQQCRLQKERHAILKAALDGHFEFDPYDESGAFQQYLVNLHASSPILVSRFYHEAELREKLIELDGNEQLRIGGLLYLVGEPAVFWSMMHLYRIRRTTTHAKWDKLLLEAKRGCVECMFFRSVVGCLTADCMFKHNGYPAVVTRVPIPNMTTDNDLLTPLLGFAPRSPSPQRVPQRGLRIPLDPTKRVTPSSIIVKEEEGTAVFSDPVWGACDIPETRPAATAEDIATWCAVNLGYKSDAIWDRK